MDSNLLAEVELYMDNRDSYTVEERKKLRESFKEQLRIAPVVIEL